MSGTILTSETQPPELKCGAYWERSPDPFHASSFPDNIDVDKAVVIGGDVSHGEIKQGWMLIDWIENPIGFVSDGSNAGAPQEFEIKEGKYKRLCAYPIKESK